MEDPREFVWDLYSAEGYDLIACSPERKCLQVTAVHLPAILLSSIPLCETQTVSHIIQDIFQLS